MRSLRQMVEVDIVPFLGLDDGGVLADGIDPAIHRPALAAALLDENRGPMLKRLHGVKRAATWARHGTKTEQVIDDANRTRYNSSKT